MFEFLFGRKNPTKNWQRIPELRLTFDLECGELNGIGVGERLERLAFLGPCEGRHAVGDGDYQYFSLGLSVGCYNEEQTIDCFEVIQYDPCEPKYQPYAGACRFQGECFNLGRLTEEQLLRKVGPPFWRDKDEDEVILFYEFPHLEW